GVDRADRGTARHRLELRRRRPGRRDAGRTQYGSALDVEHWKLTRDADGLAWLTFDRADAAPNTLAKALLEEFNTVLDALQDEPPKGLVIRSGKANGFIAGADVDEF